MRAAVLRGPGDLVVEDLPEPTPAAGEVVLRVTSAGVCGSDATAFRLGQEAFPPRERGTWPVVLGHEFAGVVTDAGPGVALATGELVACGAGVSCGVCDRCLEGRTNLCRRYVTAGAFRHGGLAEYVAVPAATCVPAAPYGVSGDDAALGQPMAIACHALARARTAPSSRVLVIGAGGVGAFATWAASRSAAAVTVCDADPARLALARALGATVALETPRGAPLGDLLAEHAPWDVVLDTTGADAALQAALAHADRGARIVLIGYQRPPSTLDLARVTRDELDLLGTHAHACAVDLPKALRLLGEREGGWADVAPVALALEAVAAEALVPLSEGRSTRVKTLVDPVAAETRPYRR
jgi:(R,R)-butanediol dehydrogenase/meso-butanediol dehydrogenase/diacetyl reductase